MKTTKRRIFLLALMFSLLLSLFCSCEKEEPEKPKAPEQGITVWSETEYPLPVEYMFRDHQNSIRYRDDRIYTNVWKTSEDGDAGTVDAVTVSWNRDGSDFREETDTDNVVPAIEDAIVYSSYQLSGGSLATFEVLSDNTGMTGYFCVRDETDGLLFSVDLPACFGQSYGDEREAMAGNGFLFRDAATVGEGKDCKYLAASNAGLVCFDRTGAVLSKITPCDVRALTVTDGAAYYFQAGDRNSMRADGTNGKYFLYSFDAESGERGAELALPAEITAEEGTLYGGFAEGYSAYWKNGKGLYGLYISENAMGEPICESTLMIDWNESDLFGGFEDLLVLDNDTVCATSLTFDSSLPHAFSSSLHLLHRLPPQVLEGQIRMEVASLSPFDLDLLRAKAVLFNKSHPGCHITVTDRLSDYGGDYDTARTQLDLEIAAGKIPDILFVSNHNSNLSIAEDYTRAGVFCDLAALAGESAVFDYDDLLGCLKKPFTDEQGRQFVIPTLLNSGMIVSNGSTLNGPMTAEEAMAYYETLPEDVSLLVNDPAALQLFLELAMVDDLTDKTAGVCSFDDGRFADMLTFCRKKNQGVQKDITFNTKRNEQIALVKNGQLILFEANAVQNLYDYIGLEIELGGSVVPVGYPNEERLVYGSRYFDSYIGITQACEHKAEALEYLWEFYKPLETTRAGKFGMEVCSSMTRTGIYAQADALAGYTVVNADSSAWRLVSDEEADSYDGAKRKITREDAEHYIAYLDSVDRIASSGGKLWEIINEELFSDVPAEPEKIAQNIQSRAALYLAEQKIEN